MVESIRQEALIAIENAIEAQNQLKKFVDVLEDLKSSNGAFYRFMQDRTDFFAQLQEVEEHVNEASNMMSKHIETIEATVA